jgi:hypothetical protein
MYRSITRGDVGFSWQNGFCIIGDGELLDRIEVSFFLQSDSINLEVEN